MGTASQSASSPIHFSSTGQVVVVVFIFIVVVFIVIVVVFFFFFGKGVFFVGKSSSGIVSDLDSGWHISKGIEYNRSTHRRESPQRVAASLWCTSSGGFHNDDRQRRSILRERRQVDS